jgi:hypothetical protein
MKGILKGLIVAGLGLALVATPAAAQGGLMIGGGLTLPKENFSNTVKSGYHAMAALDFSGAASPLGLRIDGSYHLNDYDVSGDPDAAVNTIAVGGDLVMHIPMPGAGPYVMGGVTWATTKCVGDDCASSDATDGTGWNFGGGIDFGGIFAEAKYVTVGGDLDIKFVPITVGFHF